MNRQRLLAVLSATVASCSGYSRKNLARAKPQVPLNRALDVSPQSQLPIDGAAMAAFVMPHKTPASSRSPAHKLLAAVYCGDIDAGRSILSRNFRYYETVAGRPLARMRWRKLMQRNQLAGQFENYRVALHHDATSTFDISQGPCNPSEIYPFIVEIDHNDRLKLARITNVHGPPTKLQRKYRYDRWLPEILGSNRLAAATQDGSRTQYVFALFGDAMDHHCILVTTATQVELMLCSLNWFE